MNRDVRIGEVSRRIGAWRLAAPAGAIRASMRPCRAGLPLLAAVLSLLAVPDARAGDIRKPDGTPLPATADLDVQMIGVGEPLRLRVTYFGLKARELPAPLGANNNETGAPLEYLDTEGYFSAMDSGAGDDKYYLLVVSRIIEDKYVATEVLGWVLAKYLLTTTHALEDPGTKLYQKAMVVNSLDDIAEDLRRYNEGKDEGARFGTVAPRTAPRKDGPPAGEDIRLFNLFFIYAKADNYVLIGRALNFNPINVAPRNVLVGWLPKERICEWLTRESLYWSPAPARHAPGLVFKTARDADANLEGGAGTTVTSEVPAGEGANANAYGRKLFPIQMRFPLLEWSEREPQKRPNNQKMLRIGAFGDFMTGDEGGGLRSGITEEKLARIQEDLTRAQREAKRVELVFLVDETESMKAWLPVVVKTIEGTIARVRETAGRRNVADVWIAIAYYGDTFGGAEAATPAPLVPAASADFDRALQGLRAHTATPDGDMPERVFYGLGQAIDGARFSKVSRKMVFLFGDMGNKKVEGDPTLDELIDKLVPDDPNISPTEFYAVQLGVADGHVWGEPFRKDMIALSKAVSDRIKARTNDPNSAGLSSFTAVSFQEQAGPLIQEVVKRFEALRILANKIADLIDNLRLTFGNPLSPATVQALKAKGVPIEELRQIRGAQVFQPGYIWVKNKDGQTQIRNYLLVTDKELKRFLEITEGFDLPPDVVGSLTIEKFIKILVDVRGGEVNENMTANEVLQRKAMGFKISRPSFDKLIRNLDEASLNGQEMADIRRKRSVLADILKGQKFEYTAKVMRKAGFEWTEHIRTARRAQYDARAFYFPGDNTVKWYWIDFAEEWP